MKVSLQRKSDGLFIGHDDRPVVEKSDARDFGSFLAALDFISSTPETCAQAFTIYFLHDEPRYDWTANI